MAGGTAMATRAMGARPLNRGGLAGGDTKDAAVVRWPSTGACTTGRGMD
jgi:hypothetical protein